MRTALIFFLFCAPFFASAAVFINEIQIAPTKERFIELYNSDSSDVDLTDWYIQRKTATNDKFGSLVTSTKLADKIIRANGYFLISRSQLNNSDVVVVDLTLTESNTIRIRDSKGKDVNQIEFGSIDDGKSYQRTLGGMWSTGQPTPGTLNNSGGSLSSTGSTAVVSQAQETVNTASFPVEPQIFADAGASTRSVSIGAPIVFTGQVFGLKKEPITNARLVWSFGDGAHGEGTSVSHTYYYPGEYILVLDASSGHYSASDRITVRVSDPNLSLQVGGDKAHSFIVIENKSSEEIDLSSWQVLSGGKTFIFPQNTILGPKKILKLASEVSLLLSPVGSTALLNFPNGSRVDVQGASVVAERPVPKVQNPTLVRVKSQERIVAKDPQKQLASVSESIVETTSEPVAMEKNSMWPWYIGAAFLAALALLGLRLVRTKESEVTSVADTFEIIEDDPR